MQLPPLSVLTAFPKSNYVDPVVRGPALIIITTIMFPITLFMVILRVYTRIRVTRSFGLDDTLLVLAILPTVCSTSVFRTRNLRSYLMAIISGFAHDSSTGILIADKNTPDWMRRSDTVG